MGSKYLLPLLCIVLLASCIPLWANPRVTDQRDDTKGSPIELSSGSPGAGVLGSHASLVSPPILSSEGFTSGYLPLLSTRSISKDLPAHVGVLFQDCSAGPDCLYGVGLMVSF